MSCQKERLLAMKFIEMEGEKEGVLVGIVLGKYKQGLSSFSFIIMFSICFRYDLIAPETVVILLDCYNNDSLHGKT